MQVRDTIYIRSVSRLIFRVKITILFVLPSIYILKISNNTQYQAILPTGILTTILASVSLHKPRQFSSPQGAAKVFK